MTRASANPSGTVTGSQVIPYRAVCSTKTACSRSHSRLPKSKLCQRTRSPISNASPKLGTPRAETKSECERSYAPICSSEPTSHLKPMKPPPGFRIPKTSIVSSWKCHNARTLKFKSANWLGAAASSTGTSLLPRLCRREASTSYLAIHPGSRYNSTLASSLWLEIGKSLNNPIWQRGT